MCGIQIAPNKIIYIKNVLIADGISMNGEEIIFWNSKHTLTGNIANEKSSGKKILHDMDFPSTVKRQLVIWQPRQKIQQ